MANWILVARGIDGSRELLARNGTNRVNTLASNLKSDLVNFLNYF